MFTSIKYVLKENSQNLYRIYCIAKYELLADMRDSKFGIFWNFASPAIQVLTYWLIFGIAWSRKPIGDIEYLPWLVVGYAAWWFIQPCIQSGCSAIFSKTSVITKHIAHDTMACMYWLNNRSKGEFTQRQEITLGGAVKTSPMEKLTEEELRALARMDDGQDGRE